MNTEKIYFDHAATTPIDDSVLEKMLPFFKQNYGNADSPHSIGRNAMNAVDEARDSIAALLHVKSNEVYFTSGGTESDNWALLVGAYAARSQNRKKIVVSAIEHHAVIGAAEKLQKEGFDVAWIPVNQQGQAEITALEKEIDDSTALVALMAVNNETGVIQPIKTAVELAHNKGSLFFTDAVQAAPYMPIDAQAWGVDMLSISAHKFYGPKGCGALYIRSGIKTEKLIVGGEQERGLRGGTVNVPSVVGLAEAYKQNVLHMTENNARIKALRELFLSEISILEGVHINGEGEMLPSVLNLRFDGVENTAFLFNMDLKGVCLAAGSACASASVKPSHVLTAMGLTEKQAKESVRFSFGKNNTEEEIRRGAAWAIETVNRLRNM